jgi:hypothetical protein
LAPPLPRQLLQLPRWRKQSLRTQVIARSSIPTQIARIWTPGNPYTDGSYYRDPQNTNAVMSHQVAGGSNAYRYHGGPKYND